MNVADSVRSYWDVDAATYDHSPDHGAAGVGERAAWAGAMARLLPPAPARVLDAGAGTGFLSLAAARLGHQVTALDLSAGMLERLRASAEREGLEVTVVEGPAEQPPEGPFDAVIERHLLWTLPGPVAALAAWRKAAPDGRLVCFEGLWGQIDPVEHLRARARELLRQLRGEPHHHHDTYPDELQDKLPFIDGLNPDRLAGAVAEAGWPAPRLERLRDVEWARLLRLPPAARLLGVTPQFAVVAGR